MADNLADQLFPQQCGCADCEAAVSPAAYLTALFDYTLKHVRNNKLKFDLQFLEKTLHQPFSELPTDCEAVEKQVRQVRICVEVLRSYLGNRPLADPAKEAALAKAEADYRLAAYSLLLSRIGTTYAEIRRIHKELPESRQALAERLGIDLTQPRPADPPGDELDQLLLDTQAQPLAPHSLTEQVLERLFGLADTTRDPLSEATKLGDALNQLTRWNLNGAVWDQNTDSGGMVYVKLINPAANVFQVELYQDSDRTKLVATGKITTASGTVKLVEQNNSGLSGVVEIAYTSGSNTISIAAIPTFLAWQLKHLRTLWTQQDYPTDGYSEEASPKLLLIDPDLIGPDDFRKPIPVENPAFDLWLKRRQAVDQQLRDFKANREANGLNSILQAVFGNPLPTLDGVLLTLTKGGTTDEIKAAKNTVIALGLTLESFTQLMTIRAKDQLASDPRNEKVSEAEWSEVYSILTQVTKVRQFDTWRTEEQNINLLFGTQEFWLALSEPKEGDWPPVLTPSYPLIDPAIAKLADLPDVTVGKAAIALWNDRKTQLEQIPKLLKAEREANGFEAMLRWALGSPNAGDALQYDLETLKTNLADPDEAIRNTATNQIENALHLTVDTFKRLMVIKANNNPTATEWAEVYAILTPARKVKHEYPNWVAAEKAANLDQNYWQALKAKLPRWRATLEARNAWQQALRVRDQRPIIDPTVMGADDLQRVIPGDPVYDIWKARSDGRIILLDGLKNSREADANTLDGLDKIIKTALEIEAVDLEAIDQEQQAGYSIEKRLEQLNLTYGAFTYLMRIRGLAKAGETIIESEWDIVYATLAQPKIQRRYAALRIEEYDAFRPAKPNQHILLSTDFFKIPKALLTLLPSLDPSVPIWLSTWEARRDWQDALQSRVDQENSTIEALRTVTSTAEEAALPPLRNALIQASDTIGSNLEEQAEWITGRLLIDAKAGGCQVTTRVEQAIETIQLLLFKLRSGEIKEQKDWLPLQNSPALRPGSAFHSTPLIIGGAADSVLAVVGEDSRVYSTFASQMFDGPWTHVGIATNHTIPATSKLSLFSLESQGEASLFATDSDGHINFTSSLAGNNWSDWAAISGIQVRTAAKITIGAVVQDNILHAFVVQDNGQIYGNWRDTQWHDWNRIGNETFQVPIEASVAAASLKNEIYLFVVGSDGKIYRTQVNRNVADDWTPIDVAGTVTFLPGAAIAVKGTSVGDAIIELIAVGKDGGIYHTSWNEMTGDWVAWLREGTLAISADAMVTMAGEVGSVRLFTVGQDRRVYARTGSDWEPIGDTTSVVSLPVASRFDPAGALHLYLAKGNQVLTTSQSVPSAPWNLSVFSLTLQAEQFDEEWQWIGSYATWRAAMFVYLYPENILQPSLLKYKTPAFETLVKNTRTSRIDPKGACGQAETYANYFRDVCSLEIKATCQASTIIYVGEGCDRQKTVARSMFYMFGLATSGKIYWSAYDAGAKFSNYNQTSWKEVTGFSDKEVVVSVIGAMPYRVSYPVQSSYIHLFCITRDGAKQALKLARLNLDNFDMWDDLKELDLPPNSLHNLEIVPVQTQSEINPPALVLPVWNASQSSYDRFYYMTLNTDGTNWNQSGDWNVFLNYIYTEKYPNDSQRWLGIKAALNVNGVQWFIKTGPFGNIELASYTLHGAGRKIEIGYGSLDVTSNENGYIGVLPGLEFEQRFHSTQNDSALYFFWREKNSDSSQYRYITTAKSNPNPPFHETLADLSQIPPHSGGASSGQQMFAYQRDKNAQAYYMYQYAQSDDKLIGSATIRAVPRVQARLDIPISVTDIKNLKNVTDLKNRPQEIIDAFALSPLDIPLHLSTTDLENRRQEIIDAFALNTDATSSVLAYLREAYYFVPLNLALALQTAGHYQAALDCFRTIYDYEAQLGTPNRRNIYYGLELDTKLPDISQYQQADGWLLDPLNPHLLAATRRYAYTRFTIMSLVRCLLDFADSEFTYDTGESLARARTLYSTALELLNLPELQQKLGKCDDLIAELKIEPGKDIPPEVPAAVGEIMEDLTKGISIPLSTVVQEVGNALKGAESWRVKLALARTVVQEASAQAPLPRPIGALSSGKVTSLMEKHTLLLTQLNVDHAAKAIGDASVRERIDKNLPPKNAQPNNQPKPPQGLPQPPLVTVITPSLQFCIPPNPILKALRLHAKLNLSKLRSCRNIAGIKRELEPYAAPTDTTTGLPTTGAGGQLLLPGVARIQPTLYRYPVLIERAKQLIQLAGQIEATFFSVLLQHDVEAYNLLKARQDLSLAQAGVQLQNIRITEANDGVTLAGLQKTRTENQLKTYQSWIEAGLNEYENQMINAYKDLESAKNDATKLDSLIQGFQTAIAVAGAGFGAAAAAPAATALVGALGVRSDILGRQFEDERISQVASVNASFERRKQEWELQELLASQDVGIGEQQITLATDRVNIVTQEKVIAELQTSHAKDTIEFLTTKFTNVNLYDWMSGILEGVYRFFLQQATAMAKLAENQLAFERQEVPPAYIQADYWIAPSDGAASANPNAPAPDHKGLTGSARLLQDIYQLDQYAFNTNKRKLQLSKTISLALLAPDAFQRFRETGVMIFATPMEMFDRDFPGHYLRLIHRVRTSVIALIPPTQGIHATLTSSGLSRTVIGPDIFQTVSIRRDPEFVALSSPANSTGMFELESLQPDMLFPFEGNGVDSTWEFRMPKAANQLDYRTIADVLVTIEYTALNSFDYCEQVIQTLKPNLSADRPFSFRNRFADQWYDLNNPDQTKTPMKVKFQTFREDFPPNLETLKIQQVLLYFVLSSQKTFELPITTLRFTEQGNQGTVGGSTTPIDGKISTRSGNAGSWTAMIGKSPVGEWELTLPNTEEVKKHFLDEEIDDILFVITYAGRTPDWPT